MLNSLETIELENQFYQRNDAALSSHVEIGQKLGEGMYSDCYFAKVNGEDKIIRFFKLLGPNDQLPFKRNNINKEMVALEQLKEKGVDRALDTVDVKLRHINYTGPQNNNEPVFWENNPITFGDRTYVAYQVCDYIPGTSFHTISHERGDHNYVTSLARQFGEILAVFHHAALEVAFPRYKTDEQSDKPEERLSKNDHSYRHIKMAVDNSAAAHDNPEQATHHALAQRLYSELMPLYEPDAQDKWRAMHGDLGLLNLIIQNGKITGIVDWDKARTSVSEYDFRGIALLPNALDVAVDRYLHKLQELGEDVDLSEEAVRAKKAMICKLAIVAMIPYANPPEESKRLDKREPRDVQIAKGMLSIDILLQQLVKYDPSYAAFTDPILKQANNAEVSHPGIHLRVA